MAVSPHNNDAEFFSIPPLRLFLLSVVTFNLYNVYWFYKQWKAVKYKEKSRIYPFWRAWFDIFFALSLFKRVSSKAHEYGYFERFSFMFLGISYILLTLTDRVLTQMSTLFEGVYPVSTIFFFDVGSLLFSILSCIPLMAVQQNINFYLEKTQVLLKPRPFSKGEIIIASISGIIYILFVTGIISDFLVAIAD